MSSRFKVGLIGLLAAIGSACIQGREITACGHHDYPPWNWMKNEEIVGACADIAKRVFTQLGHTVNMRYVGPWARCQRLVETGEVDVNICATKNDERLRYSEFSAVPMGVNYISVFTRVGNEFPFEQWEDLSGRTVAKINGVFVSPEFDDFLSKRTKVSNANTAQSMWAMLSAHRVDAAVMGREAGLLQLRQLGLNQKITPLPKEVLKAELFISVSKKSTDLVQQLPQINAYLARKAYKEELVETLSKQHGSYP